MKARRILGIVSLLIAVASVVLAVLPFRRELPVRGGFVLTSQSLQSSCGSPITGAFRKSPPDAGWFGYSPSATGTIVVPGHFGCRGPARDRLGFATGGFTFAFLLGVLAFSLGRRKSPTS